MYLQEKAATFDNRRVINGPSGREAFCLFINRGEAAVDERRLSIIESWAWYCSRYEDVAHCIRGIAAK